MEKKASFLVETLSLEIMAIKICLLTSAKAEEKFEPKRGG